MKYCDSIVGRKHEQDILQMCYDSPKAEYGLESPGSARCIYDTWWYTFLSIYLSSIQGRLTIDDLFK